MLRNRTGPSRAAPSTLCQKCLQRGHYSYECKSTPQDRPYLARPSRTQQLLNPKLVPKLTSDTPPAFSNKEGVADAILKKRAEEREAEESESDSDDSVSSISTGKSSSVSRSPSPAPPPKRERRRRRSVGSEDGAGREKRTERRDRSRSPYRERRSGNEARRRSPSPALKRERSLSPFSKRAALTRSMR